MLTVVYESLKIYMLNMMNQDHVFPSICSEDLPCGHIVSHGNRHSLHALFHGV